MQDRQNIFYLSSKYHFTSEKVFDLNSSELVNFFILGTCVNENYSVYSSDLGSF